MLATLMHFGDLELPDPGRVFTPVLQPSLSMGPDFRVRFAGWRFDSGSGAAARTVR
jgi:hypothetical protein